MPRLDLNLLQVLDAVLSEGSVARAARRLHVTPSAVSNNLARLRTTLGDPLVIRRGRGVIPTPRAVALAPTLRQALHDLERAVQTAPCDPATSTRRFTLAMSDVPQIARLPAVANQLARSMPRAELRVIGIDTYLSWGGTASTEIDAAIVGVQDKSPGVHAMPLYREEGLLVAREGNRLTREPLTRAKLATLQHVDVHVAPERGFSGLEPAFTRLGIARHIVAIVPSFVAAAAMVAASDCVAVLPASLLQVLGEPLKLRLVKGPIPKVTSELKLVWHERTLKDPASVAFRDVIVSALARVRT
jgi:DNA-binding transcriptional LysR family regulator